MVGDVVLLVAVTYLIFVDRDIRDLILVLVALRVWHSTGGLEAWRPSVIRQFLANAKKIGL